MATGKNFSAFSTMSVSLPSGRWNLMDIPWGMADPDPSATFGIPSESEKRTVTGIALPSNRAALLSPAACGDAVKLPSTTTPLA